MKKICHLLIGLLAGAATLAGAEETQTLKFSDPSNPGRLELRVGPGDVTIIGTDQTDVTIRSAIAPVAENEPRADGLRRLDRDGSYSVTESKNVIRLVLDNSIMQAPREGVGLTISVPRATSVSIDRNMPGETSVQGVAGNLDIRGVGGPVKLEDVSGGVLVETASGEVFATFSSLAENSPVSITAINGDIALQVPTKSKATLRMRTLHGEILTDFPDDVLKSRFENAGNLGTDSAKALTRSELVRAEAEMARAEAEQVRAMSEQVRSVEMQRHARSGLEREQQHAADTTEAHSSDLHVNVDVHVAPRISIPPMSGGKLVTGTLNGGGADLILTTMMGNITLRKKNE